MYIAYGTKFCFYGSIIVPLRNKIHTFSLLNTCFLYCYMYMYLYMFLYCIVHVQNTCFFIYTYKFFKIRKKQNCTLQTCYCAFTEQNISWIYSSLNLLLKITQIIKTIYSSCFFPLLNWKVVFLRKPLFTACDVTVDYIQVKVDKNPTKLVM